MRFTPSAGSGERHGFRAIALATAVSLALAACGSSGSGTTQSSSTTAASTAAPTTASTSASTSTGEATTASTSTGSAQPGGTTAAGTKLALGASALVDYHPGTNANSPTLRLQVSVLSIQKGSQADMNGVELEKSQRGQTPYYVKLRIRNEGAGDADAEEGDPAVGFDATDDRGEQGQELSVIGTFRPCESATQPKPFTRGVTYTTCVIYMVGGGGSIVQEEWTGSGGDAYTENPIVWKAG
jgi:hypothetical protein